MYVFKGTHNIIIICIVFGLLKDAPSKRYIHIRHVYAHSRISLSGDSCALYYYIVIIYNNIIIIIIIIVCNVCDYLNSIWKRKHQTENWFRKRTSLFIFILLFFFLILFILHSRPIRTAVYNISIRAQYTWLLNDWLSGVNNRKLGNPTTPTRGPVSMPIRNKFIDTLQITVL